jgi:hypothetical protein
VGVGHALGLACGAARVAEAGRRILVQLHPREIFILRFEQFLIAEQIEAVLSRHVCTIGEQHVMLDRFKPRCELLDQR